MSWQSADARLTVASPMGPLTIAENDGAIVSLDWASASDSSATPLLERAARQLDLYFAGRLDAFDLPLRPAGTAFERRVWHAMIAIPCGRTASYGEIAKELGSTARAVGGACGANPIPVIIPCHRIVGAGGALGGYSGGQGVETKRFLLELEGALQPEPDLFAPRARA